MDREPSFPEGARTWDKIRTAADWLSRPLRDAAPGQVYETPRTGEEASFTEHERAPRHRHRKGGVAFVGGALDEGSSRAVYEAYRRYVAAGLPAAYFTESQGAELAKWLDDNAGHVTAVYGHSYGADTAAKAFADGHGKGVALYTVDPVSRLRPDYAAVRRNAGHWVNDNSTSNSTRNDFIANVGRRWGDAPARYATHHISLPYEHVLIWKKMRPHTPAENAWT